MKLGLGVTVWRAGMANDHLDGIGYYSQELYHHLAATPRLGQISPVTFGRSAQVSRNRLDISLPNYRWTALRCGLTGIPFSEAALREAGIDLFHATDHYTPRFRRTPVLATLMDAIPLSHPEWVRQRARHLKNWLWRKSAHWADHIVTISDFSKLEICRCFGVAEQKVSVIPLGVDARYFERISEPVAERQVSEMNLPACFFLFVGTLQPRKNLARVLDAHDALPPALRKEYPLLIIGRNGWGSEALIRRINAYPKGGPVRWLTGINDLTKRILMQRATALVFPSLLEGFGLPVLEGFASRTPVITSNVSSLPEVAGAAAWLVNPTDTAALTEAMAVLAREPAVAERHVAMGLQRAQMFTWGRCAENTHSLYRRLLS